MGFHIQTLLKKLKVIQNKAIYAITKTKSYKQKLAPLYHKLEILPIRQLYKIEIAKFMHKLSTSSLPQPLLDQFSMVNLRHSYSTKNQLNYSLSCDSSSKLQTSFIFNAIKIWNSVPISIRNLPFKLLKRNTLNSLKKHKICAYYSANLGHIDTFFFNCFFFVKRYFLIFLIDLVQI